MQITKKNPWFDLTAPTSAPARTVQMPAETCRAPWHVSEPEHSGFRRGLGLLLGNTLGRLLPLLVVAIWSVVSLFGGGKVDFSSEEFDE